MSTRIMMNGWRLAPATFFVLSYSSGAWAQTPVILQVDLENYVQYFNDVADPSKLASIASRTTVANRASQAPFVARLIHLAVARRVPACLTI